MAKYIDADLMALNESEAYMSTQTKIEDPILLGLNSVVHRKLQQLIAETPAADVEPVVRCRECKHCDPENYHCDHPMGTVAPLRRKPDDFCSYGERKEGAD